MADPGANRDGQQPQAMETGLGQPMGTTTTTPRILIGAPSPYPLQAVGKLREALRTRPGLQAVQAAYLLQWLETDESGRRSGLRVLVTGEQIGPGAIEEIQQHAAGTLGADGKPVLPVMHLEGEGMGAIAKQVRDGFLPFYERGG